MSRQPRQFMRQGVSDLPTRQTAKDYVGAPGEPIFDFSTLRMHDGVTPGGIPLLSPAEDLDLTPDQQAKLRENISVTAPEDAPVSTAQQAELNKKVTVGGDVSDATATTASGVKVSVKDVASNLFPSAAESKRVVIFGSSNGTGLGASGYSGDPTAANGCASPPTSWAGLLRTALKAIDNSWEVINRSISGSGTAASVARFWTDVAPYRPSHVVLCTHPLNDNIDTQLILRNTELLCRMCDQIGAVPILRGAYC